MIDDETPTFLGSPHATGPEGLEGADVVVIGSPYVVPLDEYAGVEADQWRKGPQRVRQQSARYGTWIQDLDLDLAALRIVDYGDAALPEPDPERSLVDEILAAQGEVAGMVDHAIEAGAMPIVLGQNSPCATYALGAPVVEACEGRTGMVSLDAHWDSAPLDWLTRDPRIAGSGSWKHRLYADFPDRLPRANLVDIGERGMLENREHVEAFTDAGAAFVSGWQLQSEPAAGLVDRAIDRAYDGTDQVMFFLDLDVLGGAGPGPGDTFGELAEPLGMTDHQLIRIAHRLGREGTAAVSVASIPHDSPLHHRVLIYALCFLLAGKIERERGLG